MVEIRKDGGDSLLAGQNFPRINCVGGIQNSQQTAVGRLNPVLAGCCRLASSTSC